VLRNLNLKVEDVRKEVLGLLEVEPSEASGEGARADAAAFGAFARIGPLLTPLAVTALGYAHRLAARHGLVVDPMHLVAGLLILAEDRSKEPAVAASFGDLDLPRLAKVAARAAEESSGAARAGSVPHSPETLRVLARAMTIAADAGRSTASQTDLLAALVKDPSTPASVWLKAEGVDVDRLRGS
jgi:ATP-dependent Clp protease ATP-binding subunit ClpA